MPSDLSNHHRDTLEKIFRHPARGNIDWRQVISLLDAVGTTVAVPACSRRPGRHLP